MHYFSVIINVSSDESCRKVCVLIGGRGKVSVAAASFVVWGFEENDRRDSRIDRGLGEEEDPSSAEGSYG